LAQPVKLARDDSGTERSPTVIRAAAAGRSVLSGGRAVQEWLPVTEEAVVARLDTDAGIKAEPNDIPLRPLVARGAGRDRPGAAFGFPVTMPAASGTPLFPRSTD
jgi:hypothetical protein